MDEPPRCTVGASMFHVATVKFGNLSSIEGTGTVIVAIPSAAASSLVSGLANTVRRAPSMPMSHAAVYQSMGPRVFGRTQIVATHTQAATAAPTRAGAQTTRRNSAWAVATVATRTAGWKTSAYAETTSTRAGRRPRRLSCPLWESICCGSYCGCVLAAIPQSPHSVEACREGVLVLGRGARRRLCAAGFRRATAWPMGRGDAALGVTAAERRRAHETKHGRLDERSNAERQCQPLACELQRCASRNVYAPQKCDSLMERYKACIADHMETSMKGAAERACK